MESDKSSVIRFNRIRRDIILGIAIWIFVLIFLKFYDAGHYESLAMYLSFPWIIVMIIIVARYKCPFCGAIPRGRFIRYVDLNPKVCAKCGHSLKVEGYESKS